MTAEGVLLLHTWWIGEWISIRHSQRREVKSFFCRFDGRLRKPYQIERYLLIVIILLTCKLAHSDMTGIQSYLRLSCASKTESSGLLVYDLDRSAILHYHPERTLTKPNLPVGRVS